jgi:hypothetical protein
VGLNDRARGVWRKQTYPSDIQYRTTIDVTEGARDEQQHFSGEASVADGIHVAGVSDEEAESPHQATGTNVKIRIEIGWNTHAGGKTTSTNENAYRKESSPDFLGVFSRLWIPVRFCASHRGGRFARLSHAPRLVRS